MRIAAVGDNCVDIYTNKGWAFPGGGSVNFAAHASRQGAAMSYVGVIGTDFWGDMLQNALHAEGIDTTYLIREDGPTAVAYVHLDGTERTFIGSEHGVREILEDKIKQKEILNFLTGFDFIHTTLDGSIDSEIPGLSASGLKISYDFSHRAAGSQYELLPYITVAFISGQYIKRAEAGAILKTCNQKGCPLAVITFGEDGSLAFDGKNYYSQESLPAYVKDTMGSGDAFQAGVVTSYLKTGNIQASLYEGARVAARNTESFGGFGHAYPVDNSLSAFPISE